MTIAEHIQRFEDYARRKIEQCELDPMPLELKRDHTMHVLENANAIIEGEALSPELGRVCQLAALYHDIARFDQYLQFGTFRDALSFNHGLAGVRILRGEAFLAEEGTALARQICTAIACHNRAVLPLHLKGPDLKITNVVRNADKLDILRVIAEHLKHKPYNPTVILSLPDDADLCGEKVISSALAGQCALYEDLRSVNDFRVLLGTWYNDLQFESSRRLYLEQAHGLQIVEQLPKTGKYGEVRNFLLRTFAAGRNLTGRK